MHISNILKEGELQLDSVVKNYLTTAADGKQYNVTFYSLDIILAIGWPCTASDALRSVAIVCHISMWWKRHYALVGLTPH